MAGNLIKVNSNTITGTPGSVTLTGIDDNSIYLLTINNLLQSVGTQVVFRFTESGSDYTGSNYGKSGGKINSAGTFGAVGDAATVAWMYLDNTTSSTVGYNAQYYICNANNSSMETSIIGRHYDGGGAYQSMTGNGVLDRTSAVDGISVLAFSGTPGGGTFTSGEINLYKIK